jgi:hypothetical protein
MTHLIEQLRTKPERQKKAITLMISAVITLIIFGLWALSFINIDSNAGTSEVNTTATHVPDESPVKVFWDNFKTGIGEISGYFGL